MWPAAAALWNLRWQVAGFKTAYPHCKEDDLQKRFVLGSGIHGASLELACIQSSWTDNQEAFAQFVLFQTFGLYESWISEILDILNVSGRKTSKDLQFPTDTSKKQGISFALALLTSNKSSILNDAYYSTHSSKSPFDLSLLERLMVAYRAFKECRNCFAHESGICSSLAKQSCDDYSSVAKPSDLNVKELPVMPVQTIGAPIKLSLRGCVGFTDIILKIISIIDLELSRTEKAEQYLISDLRLWVPKERAQNLLKANPKARKKKINAILYGIGYPMFNLTDNFCAFLKTNGIFKFF